jgi:hypothetical protein
MSKIKLYRRRTQNLSRRNRRYLSIAGGLRAVAKCSERFPYATQITEVSLNLLRPFLKNSKDMDWMAVLSIRPEVVVPSAAKVLRR